MGNVGRRWCGPESNNCRYTVATIASEGILGGKYIRLKPGTEKDTLPVGGRIAKVQDYKSLEDQVGEIIFLATGGK